MFGLEISPKSQRRTSKLILFKIINKIFSFNKPQEVIRSERPIIGINNSLLLLPSGEVNSQLSVTHV